MVKKYFSKTCLSINAVLESGKSRHVSFSSLTGGGSVFYTDNADLQKAIENHRLFGKGIVVEEESEEEPGEEPEVDEIVEEEPSSNEVQVSSLDEAKDYLSDKYGVSRTKMKGVAGVKSVAGKYGIVFVGI